MKGQLYDPMSRSASRPTGQNVRGLTSLKLARVCQFGVAMEVVVTAQKWPFPEPPPEGGLDFVTNRKGAI